MNTQPPRFLPLGIIIIALTLVPPSQAWAKALSTSGPGAKLSTGGVQAIATGTGTAATDGTVDTDADDSETIEVPVVMPNAAAPSSSDLIFSPVGQGDSGAVVPITFKELTAAEYGVEESATYTFTKTVIINDMPQTITQTLTVKEILAELNQIEEGLNAIGFSLRDEDDGGEEGVKILTLESQSKEEEGITIFSAAGTTREKSAQDNTGSEEPTAQLKEVDCGDCTPMSFSHNIDKWEVSKGDKDIVKFKAWVDMSSKAYDGLLELHTNSETAMWLLGSKITLAEFHSDATLQLPVPGKEIGTEDHQTGKYTLEVLGDEKINDERDDTLFYADEGKEMTGSASKSVKISQSMKFWVGPVPVKVTFKLKGTPSFSYYQDFDSSDIRVQSKPGLKIDLKGSASVNLVAVEAGVTVKVTALDAELDFDARISKSSAGTGTYVDDFYKSNFSGTADWTVLSGKVYAWVEVNIPFAKDKRYEITIFNWDGIKQDDYPLFDDEKTGGYYVPEGHVDVYTGE